MANEVATTNEQNAITQKLLNDYFATLTDKLTDVQRNQFAAVAQAFGLNPFKREIYATTYKNKEGGTVMSIVTGYEVYLKRAEMNPNYNGFETIFQVVNGETGCTCKVYRKDRTMPVTSTVWMKEYHTGKALWLSKPRMMLEKVAIATAFRRAFPMDFGGMPYTTDELPEKMTGADKLEQQGFTEVQAESPNAPEADEDFEAFKTAVIPLAKKSSKAFIATMQAYGYKAIEDIPKEARSAFFKALNANVELAEPRSAPTATEQTMVGMEERDF